MRPRLDQPLLLPHVAAAHPARPAAHEARARGPGPPLAPVTCHACWCCSPACGDRRCICVDG